MKLTDKYEPTHLGAIVGQPTAEIQRLIDGFDTPNFLLYGPPGTGKTTAARCISRKLQGGNNDSIELNAADLGVADIRTKVERVGRQFTISGHTQVVILDEMETLSYEAQQSLKKKLEEYPAVFILITNDETLEKVNDALVDRCRAFHFDGVPDEAIRDRIQMVAQREGIELTPDDEEAIVKFANGSVRTAVRRLEAYRKDDRAGTGAQAPWLDDDESEPETDGGDHLSEFM